MGNFPSRPNNERQVESKMESLFLHTLENKRRQNGLNTVKHTAKIIIIRVTNRQRKSMLFMRRNYEIKTTFKYFTFHSLTDLEKTNKKEKTTYTKFKICTL